MNADDLFGGSEDVSPAELFSPEHLAAIGPRAALKAASLYAKVRGTPHLVGDTALVDGWHIETHTLGCRDAADEPDSHRAIHDEYSTDGKSVVVGDVDEGCFVTLTPSRRIDESATDYDLKARYDEFNRRFFDGRLPDIPIRWGTLKGAGGHVAYKVLKPAGWTPPNPLLVRLGTKDKYHGAEVVKDSVYMVISNLYKRSSEALDAILLHEMIHVDHVFGGWPGEGHGARFLGDRARLSKASGIAIPLTDKVDGLEMSDEVKDRPVKELGVLIRKSGSDFGYAIMQPKAVRSYKPGDFRGGDSAWVVKSPAWTEKSLQATVARLAMPTYRVPWRALRDEALLKDLLANGELVSGERPD